jgi:protein ImuA
MDLSHFPRAGELASPGARAPRWRLGLAAARHSEVFASSREAGGAAAALALALDGMRAGGPERAEERSVLWVQDAAAVRLSGRPYRPGLPEALRRRVIHVAAKAPEDALFALEEGLRCRDLAFVIGEIVGNPHALDFVASRRLSLAAEKHGVPLWLVRLDATRDLSSARMRWEVRSAPSPHPRWNPAAPGRPSWHAELFRARAHTPGEWILRDEENRLAADRLATTAPDHGDLARQAGDRSLAAV